MHMLHIIKALDREAFGLGSKVPALRPLILRGVIFLVHSAIAPISGPILVASLQPKIRMTSIDARSNITFHMGNMYVSFCHEDSAKKMGSEF